MTKPICRLATFQDEDIETITSIYFDIAKKDILST